MNSRYVALPESAEAAVAERWRIFCYSHPLTNEPEAIFESGLLAGFRLATYMGNELAQVTPCLRLWIDLLERAAEAERRGGPPRHDCAQVEHDNVDLHAALAAAIRRLRNTGGELVCDDLLEILGRTSKPEAPRGSVS